jgi:hypothetical protein
MVWAKYWAIFSQTHLVTLLSVFQRRDRRRRGGHGRVVRQVRQVRDAG